MSKDYFKSKYNPKSNRNHNWDYSINGQYFITICVRNKIPYFGDVIDSRMILNEYGNIAHEIWAQIPKQFLWAEIDEFVVMPNHIHGIIKIRNSSKIVKTNRGGATGVNNPMIQKSLAKVIRWYKGRVSYEIHKSLPSFAWQPKYHDVIISTQEELRHKQKYIKDNPKKWERDKTNKTQTR